MSKLIELSFRNSRNFLRILGSNQNVRSYSNRSPNNKSQDEPEINNEPVKYFGSNAATWQAKSTRTGQIETEIIWFQPYVVIASVAIFLGYFCWLREENDIDDRFTQTLFDQVEGLEKAQLILAHKYNRDNGIDVSEIEKRLKEIEISAKSNE